MSLRTRLALLYASLTAGILLVIGIVSYLMISYVLVNHVDNMLRETVADILENTRVDAVGELNMIILPRLDLTANVHVQVWSVTNTLEINSPSIDYLLEPLDSAGLRANETTINNTSMLNVPMRVLSVPFVIGERPGGTIQAATSMAFVEAARKDFLSISAAITLFSIILAGFAGWFGIGQALAPLKTVTGTALQITNANDLSRRIPYEGPADETGQLIAAFNRTLEKLAGLFASQQRFIADVSHELRTPLTVIKGNAELIRRMDKIDEDSLASIEQEADRMTRLVGDLLLLAQAESGKLPLVNEIVDLDILLTDVVKEMGVLIHGRVKLNVTAIDQIRVMGDRDRLKQVLINLLSNAIKHTPKGGEIFLSLARINQQARMIVRDTGSGIPEEDLPHIFDRFFRTEKSRTRDTDGGFGLGLSIAYWIVSLHEGRIEVESKEGFGTTFCIWLPVANQGVSG